MNEMMRRNLIAGGVVAFVALWIGSCTVRSMYLTPRQELQAAINSAERRIEDAEDRLRYERRLQRDLQELADLTLGGSAEEVVSQLRTRLNLIGNGVGLSGLSVSTGSPKLIKPPLGAVRGLPSSMRQQPDFFEVTADLSGRGSYAQALQVVELIEADPMLKRIDSIALRPREGGSAVDLAVGLTVIYLPTEPEEIPEPVPPAAATRFAELSGRELFRAPPPKPEPAPQPPPVQVRHDPPGPPPPPYDQWEVNAVVAIDGSSEVWLRHVGNGAMQQLAVGEAFYALTVREARPDGAVVEEEGGARFFVEIGRKLSDRVPSGQ